MASKPETTFIGSVHRQLPDVYAEKMNNPFRSGTADVWYSGQLGDLWVEYKFIPKIPKRAPITPDLSERQKEWLRDRHCDGRRVAVIVGCPAGGVVFENEEWLRAVPPAEFTSRVQDRKVLAGWIRAITGPSPCLLPDSSSPPPVSSGRRIVRSRRRSSSSPL